MAVDGLTAHCVERQLRRITLRIPPYAFLLFAPRDEQLFLFISGQ
jgi:hypothetical protein